MTEQVLAVLLSWAVFLTDYPAPAVPPDFQIRSAGWFEAIPCKGRTPCKVFGWYNNGIIYLHEKYKIPKGFATSVVVHEYVHYLQDLSGDFNESCSDWMDKEFEAYAVQNKYLEQATTEIRLADSPSQVCIGAIP